MTIKSLLNAIPEHYELRIWKRDGEIQWRILEHHDKPLPGRIHIQGPTIVDWGISEQSLVEWVAQS